MSRATPAFALVLPLWASLAACGSPDPDAMTERDTAAESAACTAAQPERRGKVIGVMTRNLYLGADLTPAIAAQTLPEFLAATTAIWQMVQKNDFHTRALALAAELAEERPALVGLQEAYVWRTQTPSDPATPATDVAYDYVSELLAALAERGVEYRPVAQVELFDFEAPTLLGIDVRLTDHSVILAREDVRTANPVGAVFAQENLLPVAVLGQTALVKRGYVAVDVRYRGEELRFVSTHLESFHAAFRTLQAQELAAALAAETRPVILVGDLNSQPGTEGEAVLAAAGFEDAVAALDPTPGLTCCWPEDLTLTSPPWSERIDYVLTRGPLEPRDAIVTGDDPASRLGGLWPSDHGGVFAKIRIGDRSRREDRHGR